MKTLKKTSVRICLLAALALVLTFLAVSALADVTCVFSDDIAKKGETVSFTVQNLYDDSEEDEGTVTEIYLVKGDFDYYATRPNYPYNGFRQLVASGSGTISGTIDTSSLELGTYALDVNGIYFEFIITETGERYPAPEIGIYSEGGDTFWFDEDVVIYARLKGAEKFIYTDDVYEYLNYAKAQNGYARFYVGSPGTPGTTRVRAQALVNGSLSEWTDDLSVKFRSLGQASVSVELSTTELTSDDILTVLVTSAIPESVTHLYLERDDEHSDQITPVIGSGEWHTDLIGLEPGTYGLNVSVEAAHYEPNYTFITDAFTIVDSSVPSDSALTVTPLEGRLPLNGPKYFKASMEGATVFQFSCELGNGNVRPGADNTESFENGTAVFCLYSQDEFFRKKLRPDFDPLETLDPQTVKVRGYAGGKWSAWVECTFTPECVGILDAPAVSVLTPTITVGQPLKFSCASVDHAQYLLFYEDAYGNDSWGIQYMPETHTGIHDVELIPFTTGTVSIDTSDYFFYRDTYLNVFTVAPGYQVGYSQAKVIMRPRIPEVSLNADQTVIRVNLPDNRGLFFPGVNECEFYFDDQSHTVVREGDGNDIVLTHYQSTLELPVPADILSSDGKHTFRVRERIDHFDQWNPIGYTDWSDWQTFEFYVGEEPAEPPESVTVDGLVYRIDAVKKTAVLTGVKKKNIKSVTIPAAIDVEVVGTCKVTEIAAGACRGLSRLTKVSIGKNVRTVGKASFDNCSKLKAVSGGAGVVTISENAFRKCKVLAGFTIGSKVRTIGKNAFSGCTKLKKVSGGAAVVTIGDSAFRNCKALASFTLGSKVKTIGKSAFEGCVKLQSVSGGKAVTGIGQAAFRKCTSLTAFTLNSKVKSVGSSAFDSCTSLKKITVKTTKLTAKTVGAKAFRKVSRKVVFKCPPQKKKAYSRLFPKKGAPETAKYR